MEQIKRLIMFWEVEAKKLKLNLLQNQAISQDTILVKDNQLQPKIQINNKKKSQKNLNLLIHLLDLQAKQVELPIELIIQQQVLLELVVQHIMIFMQS